MTIFIAYKYSKVLVLRELDRPAVRPLVFHVVGNLSDIKKLKKNGRPVQSWALAVCKRKTRMEEGL